MPGIAAAIYFSDCISLRRQEESQVKLNLIRGKPVNAGPKIAIV